ncbi:type IV secretion protein DotG [Roseomonas mucosa]|uniref:type IV secretion protein DotG n=1 Tax=Roseomonas mucosa TaxID=207340 RepID=UPI001EF47BC7|nr:type IV secretion protein DotG [Roseomonas mucosa]MCG7351418.1 type IV secretion protein DotG [Roseomonas mucosa]MCG7358077.1 type IV secretion protein DotG [Roseomonas mucosa]
MSGAADKVRLDSVLGKMHVFNSAGKAGPLRLVVIGGTIFVVLGTVAAVSMIRPSEPPQSRTARMPTVNPLPGGPNTNPTQDRLALQHDQGEAARAMSQGQSYTPPFSPSRPINLQAPAAPSDAAPSIAPPAPVVPSPAAVRIVQPMPPQPVAPATPPIQRVAQTSQGESRDDQMFRAAVLDMLSGWGGRPSRTDVVIPPTRAQQAGGADGEGAPGEGRYGGNGAAEERGTTVSASPMARTLPQQVLVPAGRGIYAHTVVAVNSDTGGPIVLQADSGPIAGDRLIGTFGRAGSSDLLVVRVQSLVHNGQSIPVDGVVIAPDSMETAVATSVDQHYFSRFILPAAAAFVQGLGQAIATTSNTQSVLSPFGGAAYSTHLNIDQQLGVAAGVAGARVGAALNQAAPRGPTVNLGANAGVGIMFLTNVSVPQR